MRRANSIVALSLAVLTSLFVNIAVAQTGQEEEKASTEIKDFSLSIGYKAWFNSWQSDNATYVPMQGANVQSMSSKLSVSHIPAISIRYKKVFLAGGYLVSSTYNFYRYSDIVAVSNTPYLMYFDDSATRKEIDANLGYAPYPSITFTAGYKQVTQNYHTVTSVQGFANDTSDGKTTYKGPTLGIMGSAHIGGNFALYANFAYGFMSTKGVEETSTASYISSELGIAYGFENAPFALVVAYKYQAIDTPISYKGSLDQVGPDVTKGFILGVLIAF